MSNLTDNNSSDILGGFPVAAGKKSDSDNYLFTVAFRDENELSDHDQPIYIGGMPLKLLIDDNNYRILHVVLDNDLEDADEKLSVFGLMHDLNKTDRGYVPKVVEGNTDDIPTDTAYLQGIPLAKNTGNFWIISEKQNPGEADEIDTLYWNGMPLEVRRYETNWYLVMSLVS